MCTAFLLTVVVTFFFIIAPLCFAALFDCGWWSHALLCFVVGVVCYHRTSVAGTFVGVSGPGIAIACFVVVDDIGGSGVVGGGVAGGVTGRCSVVASSSVLV